MSGINQASISFREDGTPISGAFDDVYFSRDGGAAESRYTFFDGAAVADRWAGRDVFTIGETGFGTGLNFLVTLAAWRQDKDAPQRLEFLTVEGWPLLRDVAAQAHAAFPALAEEAAALQAVWPEPAPGLIRVELYGGRVGLTIGMGEAVEMFSQMRAEVDAWYLDGFAPAKNPDMWREEVLQQIARLSAPDASLASFTAAGAVRRGLDALGFEVERRNGFGRKRHCITGRLRDGQGGLTHMQPWQVVPRRTGGPGHVAVIGAGIAGACVAHHLHQSGCDVTVYGRGSKPGDGASGNPRGIVMPRLTADNTAAGELYTSSLRYARQLYQRLDHVPQDWCGAVELLLDVPKEQDRAAKRVEIARLPDGWLELVQDASTYSAALPDRPALIHHHAGWISPIAACQSLLHGLRYVAEIEIAKIQKYPDGGYKLADAQGQIVGQADQVVLAAGADLPTLIDPDGQTLTTWQPPLSLSHGQISMIEGASALSGIDHVVIADGYVIPADEAGHSCCGATFERGVLGEADRPVSQHAHDRNIQQAVSGLGLAESTSALGVVSQGRTGRRLATADRLPLCGPVPDQPLAEAEWTGWHRAVEPGQAPPLDGLWVLSGLGARGLTTAPLLACLLVQQMLGGPWPVGQEVADAVDPRRFILRALRKAG
ncbi:MAG: bifunctional tRNA (5-methylaminomethyl-2-thiouridine)(34)-methyltransferase MnmD/FAD-dependent 5-carboxymethylaminomethyl-2-thiouridine(34) oxidoreductase MnmC [Alphaproteobacteria bacterium]